MGGLRVDQLGMFMGVSFGRLDGGSPQGGGNLSGMVGELVRFH